ncbi:hypothetical protein BC827DRAFT_1159530 [Russula dissimulans]|nr:hypothetical protein BC827DRAFT_1159530 [Russula dissimulans]
MITKNNQIYRQRMGAPSAENNRLKSDLETARKESAATTEERDALKTSAPVTSTFEPLAKEVEQLQQEKTALDKRCRKRGRNSLRKRLFLTHPIWTLVLYESSVNEMWHAALTQERDQLLAEKETWKKPPVAPETKDSQEQWEVEKAELVKSHDEAVTQAKTLWAIREETEKLRETERGLRMSKEKLGTRIREQQAARQKAIEEQDAAIKVAVEKATNELRNAPSANPEELVKRHAEELRELEKRLVAKHKEELNKAAEAVAAKAQESQPTPTPGTAATAEDKKAAIDVAVATAISAKEAESRANHDTALEKAVESGCRGGTMKLRLKDTQLVKAQNRRDYMFSIYMRVVSIKWQKVRETECFERQIHGRHSAEHGDVDVCLAMKH